jgi:NADH-quinone oxidoreductase subunit L
MGGLAKKIPITFVTFAVATAAIAGIPPLAGFFSKDEILWFAFASESGGSPLLWAVASFTALMTAFYMFRLLWLTFLTPSRMSHEAEHHVHESPFSMTGVLIVLAVLSAIGGFLKIPHFLEPLLPMPVAHHELERFETPLVVFSVILGLAGLAGAIFVYGKGLARGEALAARFPRLHRLLSGKYFVDELYQTILGRPLNWMAALAQRAAGRLSRVETGSLQFYVALAVAGAIGCLAWMWRHG